MHDIKCVGRKCPICGGDTEKREIRRFSFNGEKNESYDITCKNKCYQYSFNVDGFVLHSVTIFGEVFIYDKELTAFERKKLVNEIKYYKKNDRYLLELLK